MSYADNPYASFGYAAQADVNERADFIRKTYLHLAGAVAMFVGLLAALFTSGVAESISEALFEMRYGMLMVMVAFMVVSMVASRMANSATSKGAQYAGLGLYVVLEAIIFVPLLYIAQQMEVARGVQLIAPAAVVTLVLFGGLTTIVFVTAKDFSFLRSILLFASFAAMGLIVCAILFGFSLGIVFITAMVTLMCGWILYETSQVMLHYRTSQYVAASLALFASLATLFWWVLRLFMATRD